MLRFSIMSSTACCSASKIGAGKERKQFRFVDFVQKKSETQILLYLKNSFDSIS